MQCDGTPYLQTQYPILYNYITDGGLSNPWDTFNGQSAPSVGYFRVPNLGGCVPIGAGTGAGGLTARAIGTFYGEENHTLVVGEMPNHNHSITDLGHIHTEVSSTGTGPQQGIQQVSANNANGQVTAAATLSATTGIVINNTGGNGAHNNIQPSAGIVYIIKHD